MSDIQFEELLKVLDELEPVLHSPYASSWVDKTADYVREVLGDDDQLAHGLTHIRFSPFARRAGGRPPSDWVTRFENARTRARELLKAAQAKAERMSPSVNGGAPFALHPLIAAVSLSLLEDGHYAEAVQAAFTEVENRVRTIGSRNVADWDEGAYGVKAMAKAFGTEQPLLRLNAGESISDKDEQAGFALMFKGAMQGIRNPKSHENIRLDDPNRALNYLGFASLLMHRLDDAEERLRK